MEPAFEKLGLAYGFLRSAFQGDEDRFVQSGPGTGTPIHRFSTFFGWSFLVAVWAFSEQKGNRRASPFLQATSEFV